MSIEIRGVDELIAKLGKVAGVETLREPMQRAVMRLHRDIAEYPGPPRRNPGYKKPVWQRGYGWVTQERYAASAAAAAGNRKPLRKLKGAGKLGATSERLGQHWTTRVSAVAGGLEGRVGNKVSYAPLVQHDRMFPAPHQTRKHMQTGWPTDRQVIDKNAGAIIADFNRAIRLALGG